MPGTNPHDDDTKPLPRVPAAAEDPKEDSKKKSRRGMFVIAAAGLAGIVTINVINSLSNGASNGRYMSARGACLDAHPLDFPRCNNEALNVSSDVGDTTTWLIVTIIVWTVLTLLRRRKQTPKSWKGKVLLSRPVWWIATIAVAFQLVVWFISLF